MTEVSRKDCSETSEYEAESSLSYDTEELQLFFINDAYRWRFIGQRLVMLELMPVVLIVSQIGRRSVQKPTVNCNAQFLLQINYIKAPIDIFISSLNGTYQNSKIVIIGRSARMAPPPAGARYAAGCIPAQRPPVIAAGDRMRTINDRLISYCLFC